jgi:hypothetical protein
MKNHRISNLENYQIFKISNWTSEKKNWTMEKPAKTPPDTFRIELEKQIF